MVPFSFAGETLVPSGDGALFWAERDALLVADLHLEKASWFARLGQLLPPYDSHATLTALAAEIERTGAKRLYCLGDSFHDRFGCERLPPQARALLTQMTGAVDWTWIVGNHDPGFADQCGGTIADDVELGGIILRHEAVREESRPEISGHFHPKVRLHLRGRRVSRRCYVVAESKIIMPAFGSLTGGLDASHPEIAKHLRTKAQALVPVADRLLRFPIAA
ncbi:MAG: ligase-associated DNA damage response endonuclease PdeM [Sphingomicrobium sp.]